jgi:hypothetical protein
VDGTDGAVDPVVPVPAVAGAGDASAAAAAPPVAIAPAIMVAPSIFEIFIGIEPPSVGAQVDAHRRDRR